MAELSAYEAKRQRRMAQNRAALLALQLERLSAPKRPRRDAPSAKHARPTERRQSARLRELKTSTPQQREPWNDSHSEVMAVSKAPRMLPATPLDLPTVDLSGRTVVGPRVSVRDISISVARFHDAWLGRQLLPLGKVWAMQGIVDVGVEAEKQPVATYSRVGGVQAFRNALALFVNVDPGSHYDNAFQEVGAEGGGDGGRTVFFRWFAQRNWSRETPTIQRLTRVRRGDKRCFLEDADDAKSGDGATEERGEVEPEPLLLFLRQVESAYIYCGRLGFLGLRSAAQPLEFRWQLLDADALNWANIRRQLLDRVVSDHDAAPTTGPLAATQSAASVSGTPYHTNAQPTSVLELAT